MTLKRSLEEYLVCDLKPKRRRLAIDAAHDSLDHVNVLDNRISARNAQRSPLLKLPAELRNKIYEMVLCNHNIHVHQESTSPTTIQWIHTVCGKTSDHDKDNMISNSEDVVNVTDQADGSTDMSRALPDLALSGSKKGVHQCDLDGDVSIRDRPYKTKLKPINLALLFTCKQIYSDARLLPYSGNTFIFRRKPEFEAQNFLTYGKQSSH